MTQLIPTHRYCEWDQFVIIDAPTHDIEFGKKTSSRYTNSSDFYYRRKYNEYNPLEVLYEIDDEDNDDNVEKKTNDILERDYRKISRKQTTDTLNNIIYWSDIIAKSAFTYFVVYALFII